jgi:hypothetical protein
MASRCADFLHKDCHTVLPNHSVGVFYSRRWLGDDLPSDPPAQAVKTPVQSY